MNITSDKGFVWKMNKETEKPEKKKIHRFREPTKHPTSEDYKEVEQVITHIKWSGKNYVVHYYMAHDPDSTHTWTVPKNMEEFVGGLLEEDGILEIEEKRDNEFVIKPQVVLIEMERQPRGRFKGEWQWISIKER